MMIVSKDGRVWIRRGIPRVVFSFPSRGRGINNRTRERERESSNYTAAGVILSRLRWSSINFRKHVSMHVDRHFFFLPANEIYIFLAPFFPLLLSSWFLFRVLELQYIYQRLIRIPQASWRDCKQLRFLRGPLFAFAEINSRRTH